MIHVCPMNRYENYADLFDLRNSLLHTHYADVFDLRIFTPYTASSPGHNQIWIYDDVTHICKMAPTPRNTREGHFRLFAAPRSVFSPYYLESCDFRQWEISGVKKKCLPMNVCAFLGGKTTEHENFSAQRNAGQGAKHLKKRWVSIFWSLKKIFLKSR